MGGLKIFLKGEVKRGGLFEKGGWINTLCELCFLSNWKWDAQFHCIAYDYSCADWDSLCDLLRDVP